MKVVVYRLRQKGGHGSWRPRSLIDMRGARFPDDYIELRAFDAASFEHAVGQYAGELGDVIVLGDGEDRLPYVAGPFNWEMVKFGDRHGSPP